MATTPLINFYKNQKNSKAKKISIDFSGDSIKILGELKEQFRARSNSAIVNMIIGIFGTLDNDVRKELADFCLSKSKEISESLSGKYENIYEQVNDLEKQSQYQGILEFLTIGKPIKTERIDTMKRVEISDGYGIVPVEWIEIPFDRTMDAEYIGVVEVKNGKDYNVPHFYFCSQKPIRFITDEEQDIIEKACAQQSLSFKNAMRHKVELVVDENGKYINGKEWLSAPRVGIFQIPEHGDKEQFPYGAMVYKRDDIAYEEEDEAEEDEFFEDVEVDENESDYLEEEEYYEDSENEDGYVKVEI